MSHQRPFPDVLYDELMRLAGSQHGILLAVSGGADSMALFHGVLALAKRAGMGRVEVAHLNHALRGSESDADAEFVRQACLSAGVPFVVETLAAHVLQADSRGSLEESARTARYDFLQRTAVARNLSRIATAHHQQDQAETLLFSLLRGTGLRGLRGIPDVRLCCEGLHIIRPMLKIERTAVRQYLAESGIDCREDSSNATPEFARNRIRLMLKAMDSGQAGRLESSLLRLSHQASLTTQIMDQVAEKILKSSLLEVTETEVKLDRLPLMNWPEPLVRHALLLLWIRQHWPRQRMNAGQWQRLSDAAITGSPPRWSFPGGVRLNIRRKILHLHVSELETGAHKAAAPV